METAKGLTRFKTHLANFDNESNLTVETASSHRLATGGVFQTTRRWPTWKEEDWSKDMLHRKIDIRVSALSAM